MITVDSRLERTHAAGSERYIVVSGDSHAGPSLERDLREYCPREYLDEFDSYARGVRERRAAVAAEAEHSLIAVAGDNDVQDAEALARTAACGGQSDPHARLTDMDADGISADVIFAGGGNGEVLPFLDAGFGAGSGAVARPELRAVGCRIWNRWMADFCSAAPGRLVGTIQIPVWDVEASIREMEWSRSAGLTALNFPAPRRDFPPYNDPAYAPFWAAVEDLDLPMLTHTGGGEPPLGASGPGASSLLYLAEHHWLCRRSLWQLIFGFVFEQHPSLRLVFTEARVLWPREYLYELDSIHAMKDYRGRRLPQPPSEYWARNCFVVGSFMAPYEARGRDNVGVGNLLWGSDYPHVEGTWPYTRQALRNTFAGLPEDDVRLILGENAIDVYRLDHAQLRVVADRIGPTPSELAVPLQPLEFPADDHSLAFRTTGSYC